MIKRIALIVSLCSVPGLVVWGGFTFSQTLADKLVSFAGRDLAPAAILSSLPVSATPSVEPLAAMSTPATDFSSSAKTSTIPPATIIKETVRLIQIEPEPQTPEALSQAVQQVLQPTYATLSDLTSLEARLQALISGSQNSSQGYTNQVIYNYAPTQKIDNLNNLTITNGLTITSGALTVSGNISGTWTGSVISPQYGGTGLTSASAGYVLIGNAASALQATSSLFVSETGNVGIGTTSPSAYLNIKAGTATAGSAPLKFASGTLLATPETGAIEFDGSHYYGGIGSIRYQLDQQASLGLNASKGILLGDSTIIGYSGQNGVDYYLLNDSDSSIGVTINNQAVAGNTILQQQTAWTADTSKATYDWIIVEVGLNDLNPAESADTALGRYQTLIDTINSGKKASAIVIAATMTPAKQRLVDLYGVADGATAYQKWLDMNTAIMGGGSNKITGVQYRINKHTAALNDGNGNLASFYDTGDHVHENNSGRSIIASSYREVLNQAGFLTSVSATGILNPIFPYAGVGTSSPWGLLTVEQGTETNSFVVSNTGSSTPSFMVKGVNGNGLVGIGTDNPLSVLHVNNYTPLAMSLTKDIITIDANSGIASAGVEERIKFTTMGASYPLSYIGSSFYSSSADGYLSFGARNSNSIGEVMRIVGSGNVGIGTTSPSALLAINAPAGSDAFVIGSSTATRFVVDKYGNVGVGTASPLAKLQVGSGNINNSLDSQILISRAVDDSVSGNGHAFSDSSNITRGGVIGYNSYDSRVSYSGSNDYDHYAGFQSIPVYGSSGTLTNYYGYYSGLTINSGTVVNSYGVRVTNPSGAGSVTNSYGIYIEDLTKGNTLNYAIYTAGNTYSYFNGRLGLGATVPTSKLHLAGNASDSALITLQPWTNATSVGVQFTSTAGTPYGGITGTASTGEIRVGGTIATFYTTLYGNGNEVLRIATSGSVGIGTTSPSALLAINAPAGSDAFVIGSSTATRFVVDKYGNVGIGTTNPEQKLDIRGSNNLIQLATPDYTLNTIGSRLKIGFGAASGNTYALFQATDVGGSSASNLVFQPDSGNVGVGTTGPLAKLQVGSLNANNSVDSQILISRSVDNTVSGNGHAFSDSSDIDRSGSIGYNSYDARVTYSGTNDYDHYAGFQFAPSISTSGTFNGIYGFTSAPIINSGTVSSNYAFYAINPTGTGPITNNYGLYIGALTRGTNNYAVYTSGSTASYFGGNVGIGTTTPVTKLHVYSGSAGSGSPNANFDDVIVAGSSNTGISIFSPDASQGALQFASPSKTQAAIVDWKYNDNLMHIGTINSDASIAFLSGNSVEALRINGSGSVGIGTTSPYAILSISNSAGTAANTPLFAIASTTAGTATSTLFIVSANGNVGIGTTTPSRVLDISAAKGNAIAAGWDVWSSESYKTAITYLSGQEYDDILTAISGINIATYYYKGETQCEEKSLPASLLQREETNSNCKKRLGLIAEQAPREVLSASGDSVSLYDLASYTLAGVKGLNTKAVGLEERIKALEELDTKSSSFEPEGSQSLNGLTLLYEKEGNGSDVFSSLASLLSSIGSAVESGLLKFQKLTSHTIVIQKNVDSQNDSIGEGVIKAGETEARIASNQVKNNSKVFITFRKDYGSRWWIGEQSEGYFTIKVAEPLVADANFDWWVIGVAEPFVESSGAGDSTPPASNEAASSASDEPVAPASGDSEPAEEETPIDEPVESPAPSESPVATETPTTAEAPTATETPVVEPSEPPAPSETPAP